MGALEHIMVVNQDLQYTDLQIASCWNQENGNTFFKISSLANDTAWTDAKDVSMGTSFRQNKDLYILSLALVVS